MKKNPNITKGKLLESYSTILQLDTELEEKPRQVILESAVQILKQIKLSTLYEQGFTVGTRTVIASLAFKSKHLELMRIIHEMAQQIPDDKRKYMDTPDFSICYGGTRSEAIELWIGSISETQYNDQILKYIFEAADNNNIDFLNLAQTKLLKKEWRSDAKARGLTSYLKKLQGYKKDIKDKVLEIISTLVQSEDTSRSFYSESLKENDGAGAFLALVNNPGTYGDFRMIYEDARKSKTAGTPNPSLKFFYEHSKSAHGLIFIQSQRSRMEEIFNGNTGSFDKNMTKIYNIPEFKLARKIDKMKRRLEKRAKEKNEI